MMLATDTWQPHKPEHRKTKHNNKCTGNTAKQHFPRSKYSAKQRSKRAEQYKDN